jgi:hypothetical protein
MIRPVLLASCLVVLGIPMADADAQVCAGAASFASGPVRLGASLETSDGSKQYGGQLAFGKPAGPFAGVSIGRVDIDDSDESATSFGGEIGYSFSVAGKGSLEFCPIVGYGMASADIEEGGATADISTRSWSAGLMVGGVASSSPGLSILPSVGFAYVNQNLEIESDIVNFDESDDFGLLTLAAGFVFNEKVTVRPSFALPVGVDDSEPIFGIGFAFNFGSGPR